MARGGPCYSPAIATACTTVAPTVATTREQGGRNAESRRNPPCIRDQTYAVDAKFEGVPFFAGTQESEMGYPRLFASYSLLD